ncbi:chromosomal replication initiator protein DnaA [bacterium]|nr:chromosomal replication initiator protein DnaA [bacterium]
MAQMNGRNDLKSFNTNLVPYYRFNNYVVGETNNFALAFAKAISETPGKEYNPLFIYSNVGLGKTHLINAIGNEVLEKYPDSKVYYISSHYFEAELVEAIQYGKIEEFRNRYIDLDLLILDDVQFLASKESAQQEFFHTFNELFNKSKQIVITSDRPPSTLSTLEERLRSRFEGGIITEILIPNFEIRQAILRKKLEEKGILVPDEVIGFLCENIKEDIRKLEGALKETIAYSKLTNQLVSIELAKQVIKQKLAYSTKTEDYPLSAKDKENVTKPRTSVYPVIDLKSTDDKTQDNKKPDTKRIALNINLDLPPTPKKKKSLIKQAPKNIALASLQNKGSSVPDKDKKKLAEIADSFSGINSAGQTVAVNKKDIEKEKISNSKFNKKDNDSDSYLKSLQDSMVSDGISLTSAFANQSIEQQLQAKLQSNLNLPPKLAPESTSIDEQKKESSTKEENVIPKSEPITSDDGLLTVSTSASKSGQPQNDEPANSSVEESQNMSLTNIFSSHEVKEKINQIIAIGADNSNENSDNDLLGANHQKAHKKNVFKKEHKKKLSYDLKHFDNILNKINKGKIKIYYFDPLEEFTKKLEEAHQAFLNEDYQFGLDAMKDVKHTFSEMTLNKDDSAPDAKADLTQKKPLLSSKYLMAFAMLAIAGLVLFILWFILFGY